MARQLYEKNQDVENEARVLRALEREWHPVAIDKLPKKYSLDAFANFGTHHAYLEVKCRSVSRDAYPTYMISVRKVIEGLQHASLLPNGSFLLVVEWTDGVYFCDVGNALPHCRIDFGGRKDRDDREDSEPVLLVPTELFFPLVVDKAA